MESWRTGAHRMGGDRTGPRRKALPGVEVSSGHLGNRQTFLVSELIAFIPKGIVAQSGIPMDKEVHIPLPADGSGDVKLSVIFQHCPELFAAEITPRNDVMMTFPPKIPL